MKFPSQRLGGAEGNAEKIKSHPFFKVSSSSTFVMQ
jgi:hypothetical protein